MNSYGIYGELTLTQTEDDPNRFVDEAKNVVLYYTDTYGAWALVPVGKDVYNLFCYASTSVKGTCLKMGVFI